MRPSFSSSLKLLPVGPVADEVGVADQNAGRVVVGAEDADRLARLHQQGLVVVERAQGIDDGVVAIPIAGGAAGAAVDDEVLRALGDLFVEIVHQHAHGGFLSPAFAGELVAARSLDRRVGRAGCVGGYRHSQ